jgi:hypothetical protein
VVPVEPPDGNQVRDRNRDEQDTDQHTSVREEVAATA